MWGEGGGGSGVCGVVRCGGGGVVCVVVRRGAVWVVVDGMGEGMGWDGMGWSGWVGGWGEGERR